MFATVSATPRCRWSAAFGSPWPAGTPAAGAPTVRLADQKRLVTDDVIATDDITSGTGTRSDDDDDEDDDDEDEAADEAAFTPFSDEADGRERPRV